jgi:hypothetical protein
MSYRKRKWLPRSLQELRWFEPKVYAHLQAIAKTEGPDAFNEEWERILGPMPENLKRRFSGDGDVDFVRQPAWKDYVDDSWAWVVRLFRRPMDVPPRPPASEKRTGGDKRRQ